MAKEKFPLTTAKEKMKINKTAIWHERAYLFGRVPLKVSLFGKRFEAFESAPSLVESTYK